MHADPKSVKKTDCLTVFFAFLGFEHKKAAHITLMLSIPVVNFIYFFTIRFFADILLPINLQSHILRLK